MAYGIGDLVDFERILPLMRAFYDLTGIPSTITTLDGTLCRTRSGEVVGAGWKRICLDFHRVHPETERNCIESDSHLSMLALRSETACYECRNGMVDAAIPLSIDGEHLANLFTGQFFLAPPDRERFRAQAQRYGFDPDAYLAALDEIPVFDTAFVNRGLVFLQMLAEMIGEMGLVQKRLRDQLVLSHQAQAEAERLRTEAEDANGARSHFFASASHDLRQPIQAVRLFLDVLSTSLAGTAHAAAVEKASQGLSNAEAILEALFDVARIDAGAVLPKPEPVALAEVFARLEEEFLPQAAAKGLRLRMVPSAHILATDRLMLERILRNLVANAIRYTDAGKIVVGVRRRGGRACIEVCDSGPGIAPEHLRRIWDEFFQVGNLSRDRAEGLGLGLSIARKLARTLGTPLDVRSQLGRGTVFSLDLG